MIRQLVAPFVLITLSFLTIGILIPAKGDRFFGTCPQFVLRDARVLGGSRCSLGGGGGVLVSTLPIKPGYTTVEVQMPKDDDKRPPSEQEQ